MIPRFAQAGVTFDELEHRYRYFGDPVLNVTSIMGEHKMRADWSLVPPMILLEKREIGRAAHVASHYFDEGDLVVDTVAEPVRPYLEAWQRFVDEQDFEPLLLETALVHPVMRYGGTVDRFGIVHRLQALPSVVDIKTGDPEDAGAGPQTAAYEQLIRALFDDLWAFWQFPIEERAGVLEESWTRYSVQLLPTGRYKLHTYDTYQDLQRFTCALSLEASAHPSWRRAHV